MGRGGEAGPGTALCGVLSFITFFVSCFLLGFSFDTLDPTTMALMMNRNTYNLDCSRLYGVTRGEKGRFFTGLGVGFYETRFPTTAVTLKFHRTPDADSPIIDAKTNDGVTANVGMSFQYRLLRTPEDVCALYRAYGKEWNSFYTVYARARARDAISLFNVADLWTRRADVADAVGAAVRDELATRWAEVVGFQLLTLEIPSELQDEIANTTVQFQRISQAELTLQATTVAAITRQLQAQQAAAITVVQASADSAATLLDADARAAALNYTVTSEAVGYRALKDALGLDTRGLLDLVWIDTLLGTSAPLVVSVNSPNEVQG
jgi:regulator of protease activity HflC (stomatin/prohibitin superfamily)